MQNGGHVALTSFNCSKYCNLVFMSCQNDLFCPFLFYVFAAIWIFVFPNKFFWSLLSMISFNLQPYIKQYHQQI